MAACLADLQTPFFVFVKDEIPMADRAFNDIADAPLDEYFTFASGAAFLGTSYHAFRQVIKRNGIPVYRQQFRKYPQLVRRADVERLARVVPAAKPEGGTIET